MISGGFSPTINAIRILPIPEKIPFTKTISSELLSLILLVQLFSTPQHIQAHNTNNEPLLNTNASVPSKPRIALDSITRIIAAHNLLEIFSLKITRAITEVATISKLLISETLAEFVLAMPSIKNIGAAMSRPIIAIV